jgi:Tol biopolymer transport system component
MSISRVSILFLGLSMASLGCSDPSSASASSRTGTTVATAPVGNLTGTVLFGRYEGDVEHYLTTTPEGARETEIFDAEGCAPCVVLSPDGASVSTPAFSDDTLTTAIVSVDGTDRRVLSLPGIAGAWSPDSRLLALGVWVEDAPSKTGIYTARASDGSGLKQITTSGHDEFHEPFAWSPDGTRILVFVERGSIGGVTHAGDLFVAKTDGSGMRRLNPPGVAVGRVTAAGAPASWSPDGRSIAFAAFDRGTEGDRSAVFVTDASDGRARRISTWGSMIASAAWSPAGDLIAFSELEGPAISLVTPDGELSSLSVPGWRISGPVWSSDGSHLLVRRAVGLGGILAVVDLEGEVVSTVTRRPGNLFGWTWAGSG